MKGRKLILKHGDVIYIKTPDNDRFCLSLMDDNSAFGDTLEVRAASGLGSNLVIVPVSCNHIRLYEVK